MNVLVTSVGRSNRVLRDMRRALPPGGRLFAAEVSTDAPALREADGAFAVPPCTDESYVDTLLDICAANDIRLVIPLNERELGVIAEHRQRFLTVDAFPVVSDTRVIALCEDKWEANRFLAHCGLRSPRTWLSLAEAQRAILQHDLSYPVVVKPRFGSTSIGIEMAASARELELIHELATLRAPRSMIRAGAVTPEESVLIQERLVGDEYGVDVINNLAGRHVTTLARQKLRMRAGSTDRAVTVMNDELAALGRTLGTALGHIGSLDCDVFMATDVPPVIIDLNPRIGGGLPFSQMAGANLMMALVAWRLGNASDPCALEARLGVRVAKFDEFAMMA